MHLFIARLAQVPLVLLDLIAYGLAPRSTIARPDNHPRRVRCMHGQSVVEFALVSLTLLMLIFGTLDLGRGIFQRVLLTNAVREGTRYGMVGDRTNLTTYEGQIVAAAAARSPSLNLTAANITVLGCSTWSSVSDGSLADCDPAGPSGRLIAVPGARLTVCATYQFSLSAPRLIGLSTIRMTECARATLQ